MNKEYHYRKHIYWGQYVIPAGFALLSLLMLGISLFIWRTSSIKPIAIIPAVLGLVMLVEGGPLWYFYYRLAGTKVSISDDMLIYTTRQGEKQIPLESVYLEFSSIKYTGGWLKIKAGKEIMRLTVVLEDISGLVRELKTKLDNKQLSDHYDSRKLFGFLKTAVASDQSWERAYERYGKMFLLILSLGVAIFTGYIFGTFLFYGIVFALFWAVFSMIWITAAYTIAEIVLIRQIAKRSDENSFTFPARDPHYEKLVFDRTFTWGNLAYIVFSLFVIVVAIWIRLLIQV